MVHSIMTEDFKKMQARLSGLIDYAPEERYQQLMQSQPDLINRVPLHQLASYIGVTPESFSRIRKRILDKQRDSSSKR